MGLLLARRLAGAALILLGVAAITFLLLYAIPADPAVMLAGRSATRETVANIRHELGLDRPLVLQFLTYLGHLATGDLGRSYTQKTEVTALIAARLPATLILMAAGIAVEVTLGLLLGILAAVNRGGFLDRAVMTAAFVGVSAPQFVVALLLLYVFAVTLGWFPMSGFGTPAHAVLPAVTLGVLGAGWYARMVRSAMIDVLAQDYVRTARAKGVFPTKVVFKHVLKNAVLPVVALVGLDIGVFMGGIVIVESVFGWPGIGQMIWQAIQLVDIPVIMGGVIVTALFVVVGNLLADLVYPALDPRIRYS